MANDFIPFKDFTEYVINSKQLSYDTKRIEEINQNRHSENSQKLFVWMKEIAKNHHILNNPQSIDKLTAKMTEMGWPNLIRMTKEISAQCEGKEFSKASCLGQIDGVIAFIGKSNLSLDHKNDVIRELDFYKIQQNIIGSFQHDFSEVFNQTVLQVNNSEKSTAITQVVTKIQHQYMNARVTPVVNAEKLIDSEKNWDQYSIPQFSLTSIFEVVSVLGLAYLLVKWKTSLSEKKISKNFYRHFFSIQKKSGLKVRVFGRLQLQSILKMQKLVPRITSIFEKQKTFFGELHFKFNENEKVIKLDTIYNTKDSLQSFYEETSGEVSRKMKNVVAEIEEMGGEVLFSTQFSETGAIANSSLVIYIPA